MKIFRLVFILAVTPFIMGAAPSESGYSIVPRKKEAFSSNSEVREIREESVKPEEVYKNGVQEFSIIATDVGYFPSRVYVRANIPAKIYITSSSERALCFILDDFSLRKGVGAQKIEEIRFLPTKAGEHKFYCPVQEIEGKIIVRD